MTKNSSIHDLKNHRAKMLSNVESLDKQKNDELKNVKDFIKD